MIGVYLSQDQIKFPPSSSLWFYFNSFYLLCRTSHSNYQVTHDFHYLPWLISSTCAREEEDEEILTNMTYIYTHVCNTYTHKAPSERRAY